MLALYALAVFGYLTATVATFFIGQHQVAGRAPTDQTTALVAAVRQELAALLSKLAEPSVLDQRAPTDR